jgi:hypothetical protein
MSVDGFRARVPLTRYADYEQAIEQMLRGQPNPLSAETVELLEPTSGSTSGEKLVPYTQSLSREFRRGLAVWIADLFGNRPAAMRGRAYWAISPPCQAARVTNHGVRIGFDDDTSYLGPLARRFVGQLLAVPPEVAHLSRGDEWQMASLWHLLQAEDLALISVWSPTFLTSLLRCLDQHRDRLARDLADGFCRLARAGEIARNGRNGRREARAAERRRWAARLLEKNLPLAELTQRLWPSLAAISCWTHGVAGRFLPELRQLFPRVEILPKGLLCTEGIVSIPLVDQPGAALAVRSHFLEFQPLAAHETVLVDDLVPGQRYRVVITTGGGLTRYQTGDVVEVVQTLDRCPLVRFVGRESTSDLVGEKLDEVFVQGCLDELLRPVCDHVRFALLVPCPELLCYRLYVHLDEQNGSGSQPARLVAALDACLKANPYYRQARELNQLQPPQLVLGVGRLSNLQECFDAVRQAQGMRPGDVKPVSLETDPRRAEAFVQRVAEASSAPLREYI